MWLRVLVLLSFVASAFAESQPLPPTFRPPPETRSVYSVSWARDGAILGGATAAIVLPYTLGNGLIHPRCPCSLGEVNGLDRFAIANRSDAADVTTDVLVGMAMIFPPLLDYGDVGASREWLEDTLVFAQALAINGALVTAVKYLVQRPLPRTYDGRDASLVETASGYRSFYSGHVSTTMAALTAASMTLTLRHHVGAWPWLVSAGVGATVAVGRVAAGRHFPTDVLVGAAAGTAVGTLVSWLHARPQSFAIALPTPNGASVLIGTRF